MEPLTFEEIQKMSIKERYEMRKKCSEDQNIESLLSLASFHYVNGSVAVNEMNLPEMCYYFGRLKREKDLINFLEKNSSNLSFLSKFSKDLSKNLFSIGFKFPHLNEIEMQYLEEKYNDQRTFELFEIIMFDSYLLPRPLKKMDKDKFNTKNVNFSKHLLNNLFNSFALNGKIHYNNDQAYVYDRIENRIIRKDLNELGRREYVITSPIRSSEFYNLILENFDKNHADKIIEYLCYHDDIEQFKTDNIFSLNSDDIVRACTKFFQDPEIVNKIKELVSLFWLEKINSHS